MSATSRACRIRRIWRTTRHTDNTIHHSNPPADQPGKRVASWTGKSPDTSNTCDILARSSQHPREKKSGVSGVSARMSRGCYQETAHVESKLKSVCFISVCLLPIYYWQPYLSVLYSSFLLACGCGGCGIHYNTSTFAFLWPCPTCEINGWHRAKPLMCSQHVTQHIHYDISCRYFFSLWYRVRYGSFWAHV